MFEPGSCRVLMIVVPYFDMPQGCPLDDQSESVVRHDLRSFRHHDLQGTQTLLFLRVSVLQLMVSFSIQKHPYPCQP